MDYAYNKVLGFIVVAGGSGERFGGAKQLADLAGEKVLARTIKSVVNAANICFEGTDYRLGHIVVVVPQGELDFYRSEFSGLYSDISFAHGGKNRNASVRNGAKMLKDLRPQFVAVHDGVRPFLSAGLLKRLMEKIIDTDAYCAVPGLELVDSIKRIDGCRVVEAPDRADFVLVQTPQIFRWEPFYRVYIEGRAKTATDDSALLKRGVVYAPGDRANIKITQPEDIKIAESILLDFE